MIFVNADEVMRLHVTDEVDANTHARMNFPLYADIHFDGTGRAIVGIIHCRYQAEAETLIQE